MRYPIDIVQPMKNELLSAGFQEFENIEHLDEVLQSKGTTFVVVNSVCGCSARGARPAAIYAVEAAKHKPHNLYTVFAGYDLEQTARLRELALPYPASSPSMALFKDGKLVHFLERKGIEGVTPTAIVDNLIAAFEKYCCE